MLATWTDAPALANTHVGGVQAEFKHAKLQSTTNNSKTTTPALHPRTHALRARMPAMIMPATKTAAMTQQQLLTL
jgi:hypothetical protein